MSSKPKAVLGFDPGASGGLCLMSGSVIEAIDFSTATLVGYREQIIKWQETYDLYGAGLEKVGAMPGQGVTSMFSFGQRFGELIGLCVAMQIPIYLIQPKQWQSTLAIKDKDKLTKATRKKAIAQAVSLIYPSAYSVMYTVRGAIKDGVADAIGIAHHLSTTINTKV